eukprot:1185495-Prorocentrum_minimum.AAC.1
MGLETSAEVLQVGGHCALSVDDGHGGGVVREPEYSLVRPRGNSANTHSANTRASISQLMRV